MLEFQPPLPSLESHQSGSEATASFLMISRWFYHPSRFGNCSVNPTGSVMWGGASLGLKTSLQIEQRGRSEPGELRVASLCLGSHGGQPATSFWTAEGRLHRVPVSTVSVLSPVTDHILSKWPGSTCHLCALYSLEILWVFCFSSHYSGVALTVRVFSQI